MLTREDPYMQGIQHGTPKRLPTSNVWAEVLDMKFVPELVYDPATFLDEARRKGQMRQPLTSTVHDMTGHLRLTCKFARGIRFRSGKLEGS